MTGKVKVMQLRKSREGGTYQTVYTWNVYNNPKELKAIIKRYVTIFQIDNYILTVVVAPDVPEVAEPLPHRKPFTYSSKTHNT